MKHENPTTVAIAAAERAYQRRIHPDGRELDEESTLVNRSLQHLAYTWRDNVTDPDAEDYLSTLVGVQRLFHTHTQVRNSVTGRTRCRVCHHWWRLTSAPCPVLALLTRYRGLEVDGVWRAALIGLGSNATLQQVRSWQHVLRSGEYAPPPGLFDDTQRTVEMLAVRA